jgi:hypothetical protein
MPWQQLFNLALSVTVDDGGERAGQIRKRIDGIELACLDKRSDGGGKTGATIATLLQTAKMNNVDPQAWLTQTLKRLAKAWPSTEIDALMPWNYAAYTASACRLQRFRSFAEKCCLTIARPSTRNL